MAKQPSSNYSSYGSEVLDSIVKKLQKTSEPRKRYEYVMWLAKQLPPMESELQTESSKVKGCLSKVFVLGELVNGKLQWKGDSDALITKGLLALLIKGLSDLTPKEIVEIDTKFIADTGLQASLTPSRANGFLNIFLNMKAQAEQLQKRSFTTS